MYNFTGGRTVCLSVFHSYNQRTRRTSSAGQITAQPLQPDATGKQYIQFSPVCMKQFLPTLHRSVFGKPHYIRQNNNVICTHLWKVCKFKNSTPHNCRNSCHQWFVPVEQNWWENIYVSDCDWVLNFTIKNKNPFNKSHTSHEFIEKKWKCLFLIEL